MKLYTLHPRLLMSLLGFLVLAALVLCGCGTVSSRAKGDAGPYRGYAYDMEKLANPNESLKTADGRGGPVPVPTPRGVFWALDLPLSLVGDTLLLPVDSLWPKKNDEEQLQPTSGQPNGAANDSQPVPSEPNQTSPAAASGR